MRERAAARGWLESHRAWISASIGPFLARLRLRPTNSTGNFEGPQAQPRRRRTPDSLNAEAQSRKGRKGCKVKKGMGRRGIGSLSTCRHPSLFLRPLRLVKSVRNSSELAAPTERFRGGKT